MGEWSLKPKIIELCRQEKLRGDNKPRPIRVKLETWFKPDQELMIPGFQGFYNSRKKCRGGRVALFKDRRILNVECRTYFFKLQSWL